MSAFRKKRLIAQGHQTSPFGASPPAGTGARQNDDDDEDDDAPVRLTNSQLAAFAAAENQARAWEPAVATFQATSGFRAGPRDPSRDPGGGAPPEAMLRALQDSLRAPSPSSSSSSSSAAAQGRAGSAYREEARAVGGGGGTSALLAEISRANEEKVRAMGAAEVQRELQSVESVFGKELLEALRARKQASAEAQPSSAAAAAPERKPAQASSSAPRKSVSFAQVEEVHTLPPAAAPSDEPAAHTPGHHGHSHHHHHNDPNEPRFDLDGTMVEPGTAAAAAAADGEHFTLGEILQLCHSTLVSQRSMMLSVLARLLEVARTQRQGAEAAAQRQEAALAERGAHGHAAIVAAHLLGDRSVIVRQAALACLAAALAALPEGRDAPPAKTSNQLKPLKTEEVLATLLAARVLENLSHLAREAQDQQERTVVISVLHALSERSASIAGKLARVPSFLQMLDQAIDADDQLSLAAGLQLMTSIAESSRKSAEALAASSPLLQIVTRTIHSRAWLAPKDARALRALSASLRLLLALAKYGFALQHATMLWEALCSLASSSAAQGSAAASTSLGDSLAACLELFQIWTVSAEDPHTATAGGHDIVWDVVKDLPRFSIDALTTAAKDTPATDLVAASAAAHLTAAIQGAKRHAGDVRLPGLDSALVAAVDALLARASGQLLQEQALSQKVCSSCHLLSCLLRLRQTLSQSALDGVPVDFGGVGLDHALAHLLRMLDSTAGGFEAAQLRPAALAATWAVAITLQKPTQKSAALSQLLHTLRPSEERLAIAVLQGILEDTESGKVLMPFFAGTLEKPDSTALPLLVGISQPSDIRALQTLRLVRQDAATDESSEPTDPVTGSGFWASPLSGLPLRTDWPFAALDELSHSANSKVFNLPGVLPLDWDYNERDIVLATLTFAQQCVEGKLFKPSAAEVWLNLMKVFLLEGRPGEVAPEASGAATGKDLFRDPEIAQALQSLAKLASSAQLDQSASLEDVHARGVSESQPFYQTYTDLLGLYESQSFGDETFGLVVVQPLSMRYPSDYRRLLWLDFGQVLPSLKASCEQVQLVEFLEPAETNAEVLQLYAAALFSRQVQADSNDLIYRIALEHVSRAIWEEDGGQPIKADQRRLLATICNPRAPEGLRESVLHFGGPSAEVLEKRKQTMSTIAVA